LKQAQALWPFFLIFLRICYQGNLVKPVDFKFDGTQLLCYADDITVLGESMYSTYKDNTKALVGANKEIGLKVNAANTMYMVMSRAQHAERNHNINVGSNLFELVEQTLTNQNYIRKK
jgi:hypothetical protein